MQNVNVQSKVDFMYGFGSTRIYAGIFCFLGMAESRLDKLKIMRAKKVPARQVQSMFLSHVPLPRKFDFVAVEWERPMLMLTTLRQLECKMLQHCKK